MSFEKNAADPPVPPVGDVDDDKDNAYAGSRGIDMPFLEAEASKPPANVIEFPRDRLIEYQLDSIRAQLKAIRQRPRWYEDAFAREAVEILEQKKYIYIRQLAGTVVRGPECPEWAQPARRKLE